MSTTEWKTWCRLCARIDGMELKLDTIETVSNILQQYFRITFSTSKDCLSVVCQECLDLVLNVEKFTLRSTKVNKMFVELIKDNVSSENIDSVRQKYGFFINTKLETRETLQNASTNLKMDTAAIDAVETKEDLDSDVSFSDEHNYEDGDVSYNAIPSKSKEESNINRQSKPSKRKLSSELTASRSNTANKRRKKIRDPKPKPMITKRKQVKGTDVWCHLCDTTFDIPRLYMEHMRGKHTPDILPFACNECPKFFVSNKKLLQHSASHRPVEQKKIHPCPQCERTFTRTENVQLHIRVVHMGERPFVCEECGKSWATKGALKQHQITHTEARPFKCSDCSKCFKDSYSLKKHSEIHNTVSFECFLCGQRLNTRYTLREHMLVHSDEKRYKCQYCGNAYKRYPALKDHLNIHTGIRFLCPFCDVSYADRSNLRTHKKKCHPVESAALKAASPTTSESVSQRM